MTQRPDRLSALIRRFRIDARVNPTDPGQSPNLFVLRRGDLAGRICGNQAEPGPKLVFFPRDVPAGLREDLTTAGIDFVCASVNMGGEANPIARALPDPVEISLAESESLAAVADMLLEEALSPRCGGQAVVDRLCEVVVIRLLRHTIEAGQTEPGLLAGLAHPNLSLAIVAMHDDPGRNWRLEDLAEIAGMSRTHFANSFREVVGVTPGDYLSGWRMTLAREEISRGVPLKIVASRVGFSGSAALSRAFSRRFGYSPREGLTQARQGTGAG